MKLKRELPITTPPKPRPSHPEEPELSYQPYNPVKPKHRPLPDIYPEP